MKTKKHLKITSILILIVGIIHVCATPVVVPSLKILGTNAMLAHTYMFVFTGIAITFAGWLQFYVLNRFGGEKSFQTIFKMTVVFISVSGVGAVITMWTNPFAYLILLIALYEICLTRILLKATA